MILAEEISDCWKWPNFLLLAGLLGYLIRKHGGPLLADRSRQIRESLEAGERAKAEAAARAAAVQAKIASLDREIADFRAGAHADLEREADRIRREAEAEMSSHRTAYGSPKSCRQANARAWNSASIAARLAMDLAEQKVRARMSPDVQATLLEKFRRRSVALLPGRRSGLGRWQRL